MESVVFKYSDFFEDDGGFDKIRSDFDQLGDDLIKKAKEIKSKVKLFDLDDMDDIEEIEEQTEDLTKAFKKYGETKDKIVDIEKEYLKQINKGNKTTDEQIDNLIALDKNLRKYRGDLKEVNTLSKIGVKTDRDLNKERVKAVLNIKRTVKEVNKQQKEILESNKLTTKQNKLLKAKITLEKTEIKTLGDVRERMAALRLVLQTLDLDTQTEEIAAFNKEIDELTDTLSDNSDKFIQNKINIGNYEESISNALKNTSAFSTGIGALDNALQSTLGIFFLTRAELEAMEASMAGNTTALKRFTIAFSKLNKVLKASIIGVILVAIVALGSAFGNTRAGAVRLEKVMKTVTSAFATFGKVASAIFAGIGDGFVIIFDVVSQFITQTKGRSFGQILKDFFSGDLGVVDALAENFVKQIENVKSTFEEVVQIVKSGAKAVVLGLENIDNAFKIEDRVRRLNQELARLHGTLSILQSQSDDATRSLASQLLATKAALEVNEQIGEKALEIATAELELANQRVKQNILANGVEVSNINLGLKGVEFAEATLALATERGVKLEIANDLIEEQANAVVKVIEAENELDLVREESGRKQREINRDIFEQNLDLLIDLIDTEKNLSEQFVNDVARNFQRRVDEFNRFLIAFRVNAQQELDEFSKEASNLGLDLDFTIEYDDQGDFKIFVGDTELAIKNIVDLNAQLQTLGLNEIDINRFREFIVEARNGVRDFRELNKELKLVAINVQELFSNLATDDLELKQLDALAEKLRELSKINPSALTPDQRKKLIKDLESLEKEREEIIRFADDKRRDNRIDAIDAELKLVEEGSVRELELLRERAALEKAIRQDIINDGLKSTKEANDKATKSYEKFSRDVQRVLNLVLNKVLELNQKRVDAAEKRVDDQNELIDSQRTRAEQGLTNTLAFEQRELGKHELELIKRQKRQERLEKVKAIYSAYSNYASRGDKNPILKTLRDFALLEAITATFAEGGIPEDVLPKDGIFRGQSHRGQQGGIPIRVEGKEGIFSVREMENLGKENFYNIKHLAGMGKMDSNFFSNQRKEFIKVVPQRIEHDPQLVREMREVKRAIDSKPVTNWDVAKLANGVMELVETTLTKNKVQRNHYKTKKPRL